MKRISKRRSSTGGKESHQLLRPSGEAELSVAEEELIATLLAQPEGKRPAGGGKTAQKPTARTKSIKNAAAARRSRGRVAKKRKIPKISRRK